MSVIAIVLLACSLVLVLAAEWPRLRELIGVEARAERASRRRRSKLTVIEGDAEVDEETEDFAASVQRDLDRLPTTDDRDPRRR